MILGAVFQFIRGVFELLHVLVDFILSPRRVEWAAIQGVVEGAFEGVRVSFESENDLANIGANHISALGARIRRQVRRTDFNSHGRKAADPRVN